MRLSVKALLLVFYMLFAILLFAQVVAALPITETTAPYIVALVGLVIAGLTLILAWDYLIPAVFRGYRLGECKVADKKYLICRYKTSPELTGYVVVKFVPTQPIADMDRERRMSYLDSIQGLLAGAHFEVIVAYIGMRDRYQNTIREALMKRKQRILALSFRETPSIREELSQIERELRIIDQVPVILEGFYVAMAREYSVDEEDLKRKLEADARALAALLSRLGGKAIVLQGEELRNIVNYLLFGSVVQIYW